MNEKIISTICLTTAAVGGTIVFGEIMKKLIDIGHENSLRREEQRKINDAKAAEQQRIEIERRAEEERILSEHKTDILISHDFDTEIRKASTENKSLEIEDRLRAKELLEMEYTKIKNGGSVKYVDDHVDHFFQMANDILAEDADSCLAGVRFWWNKYQTEKLAKEGAARKREEEAEKKRIAKQQADEQRRIERLRTEEREQMYKVINNGIHSLERVANNAVAKN